MLPEPEDGNLLDYDGFTARVESLLDLEFEKPVNPYSGLYDELGLDSLQGFRRPASTLIG